MNDKIYPSMVIRSQAEAIELLEKENKKLLEENEELKLVRSTCAFCPYYTENKELHNKIDKAIEILKLCNSECAKETIEVLKDSDVNDKES